MTPVRFLAIFLLPLTFLPSAATAQEPIRFARTPDISPDGKTVAFSYLGDIWTVEAIGGVARPVTMHEAHDTNPVFSPDGKYLAFSSTRFGQYDVFVVPAVGGKPRRLTFDSAPDMVTGWTPDGKGVVFSSPRSMAYPINADCFVVPVEGGAERKLNLFEAKEAHFAPTGNTVAFVRGPGTWYRRGYRGSSNDDIWISNADGTNPKRVTNFDGQDSYPSFSPDGRKLYYVSENGGSKPGCANVVCQPIAPDGAPAGPVKRVTRHDDDTVRRARVSANGDWVVYECGADLWVQSLRSESPPRKLAIEVNADDKSNTERTVTFSNGASEYALSPSEEHAVLVIHGQLFLTRVPDGGKATRLTEHAFADSNPAWAPDGKKIIFASDRSGTTDLYLLEHDDPEHPELTKAHKFKTTRLTNTTSEELNPTFSPKGDAIAFVREGKLWLMKPDGSDQKVLVGAQKVLDYEWSPDGRHVVFTRMDGSFSAEVYVAATDGSGPPVNISRHATWNSDVSWSEKNGKVAFVGQRRGSYAMHVVSLQKPKADGTPRPPAEQIDWDDLHLRVERPTATSAEYGSISPDGSQVAFRSLSNGDELWLANTSGSSVTRMTSGNQTPSWIRWTKRTGSSVYFLNGFGELRFVRAGITFGGPFEPSKVPFAAKMTIKRDEEFAEMFAQCWRALSDNFYDAKHHGADWAAVRAKFLPLVEHTATREDLYALVSMMLGELNASHLGISGRTTTPDEWTADLGLIFDDAYRGPGLKVTEVLKRGPADKRGLDIKPGDVVVGIDRVPLTTAVNVSKLLNNKIGEAVLLEIASDPKDAKTKRKVEVTAANRVRVQQLMYERWVERNSDAVAKASGGKVGYIHIPSMDDAGLDAFVRALYSDHFDKDALVIDVRFNGGGFTHDQVLNYLAGKEHTFFRQRDGGEGMVLRATDRKWTKPMAVMANNRSYSDAEIFPHAFRALGLGKVVGQATGGFVIGTGSTRLIDGSSFRIPRIGVYTKEGVNMEKQGVQPDVPVEVTPEDWFRGVDGQLLRAVDVVTADAVAWKRAKTGIAGGAVGTGTPVATPAAAPVPVAPMPRSSPRPAPVPAGPIPMAED